AVEGWMRDDAGRAVLKLRVAAAAADGAANAAVVALIARTLGRPKSAVRILRGETARVKQIEITGLDEAEAWSRLGAPPDAIG
ncbi:MAG TPA: DUF167 family protein, partial [Phenylobacterium sp.]|uniref:DUF167 family protein n=1 Tax=Phenylobacterium sp. TaxID=1871053 RepID=UPI002B4A5031